MNGDENQRAGQTAPAFTSSGRPISPRVLARQAEKRRRYTDDAAPPYRCRVCLAKGEVKAYDGVSALATHVRRAHSSGGAWSTKSKGLPKGRVVTPRKRCLFPGCGKTFGTDAGVYYHSKAKHGVLAVDTGRGNVECPECPKEGGRFRSSAAGITLHMANHHRVVRRRKRKVQEPFQLEDSASARARGGFVAFRREELLHSEGSQYAQPITPVAQESEIQIPVVVTLRISATYGTQKGGE